MGPGSGKTMSQITYARLDESHFHIHSLDDFCRHQDVTECWRLIQGEWRLIPHAFVEAWTVRECRDIAADIIRHRNRDQSGFGAFDGERVVGFATVAHALFGQTARYVDLACFYVSEEYRRHGIGRALFGMACEEARRLGAQKLYISAHSSKESQAAYRALGCVHAREINARLAALEPCDVQMECPLEGTSGNPREETRA